MMVQVSLVIASLVAFNVITTESAVSIGLGKNVYTDLMEICIKIMKLDLHKMH